MNRLSLLVLALAPFGLTQLPAAESTASHLPSRPKPGDTVLVSSRMPPGSREVRLLLQPVEPGKYIRKSDPAYEKDWVPFQMRDDGKEGDEKAGDGVFSYRVPANFQRHRWLVRYRVAATDPAGKTLVLPPKEDTCPNFAWWCDAGPSAWTGAREPGKTPPKVYSQEFLTTLQSLSLVARSDDVARSQWDGNAHKQKQWGTLVYQGLPYDHIQFSNRGQGSAHISGKNKWGLRLNDGHELPFLNHDGKPFPAPCGSLNLNPGGSTPYLPVLRGITGLDEVFSMRAYRLAGVPSPPVTWVQWRVIQSLDDVSPKDQYQGDLWGVYVVLGDMKPKMLADRDKKLPDGLTISTQSGVKHAPEGMKEPDKVWEKFLTQMRSNPPEEWWRKNLDLPAYFSFHAMNRLLGNVDLRPDGNHGYYRHPDGRWAPIPWDNDMMFVPRHHQPGHIDAIACLNHPRIAIEYRNRAREILDLFAADSSRQGGQVGQLVGDLGQYLTPKGFDVDWSKLDEAVWNFHPRMNQKGSYFVNPANGEHFGGPWKRTLATNDFAGFQKYLIDFCTDSRPTKNYAPNDGDTRGYGWGYLAHEAKDDQIPAKTTIRPSPVPGGPEKFTASPFVSPAKHQPAALEWRVARLGKNGWYELEDLWRGESGLNTTSPIPSDIFAKPGAYRVRARWRDQTGRCAHWSAPAEVTVPGGQ